MGMIFFSSFKFPELISSTSSRNSLLLDFAGRSITFGVGDHLLVVVSITQIII